MNTPNSTNSPMSEYLLKIQLIVSNTEFKDKSEARKYETIETSLGGDLYVRAKTGTDAFESYTYNSKEVYNALHKMGLDDKTIMRYISNPVIMPQTIKNKLLNEARAVYLATYKEPNKYYLMLTGTPFPGNDEIPPDPVLTIPDEFYEIYRSEEVISRDQPIHELPEKYQELFMNTPYYKQMLLDNPDARYLRYIGSNSIPIEVSRAARDGDIMKINTDKLSTYHQVFGNVVVSPDIVHKFVNVYRETRDYVYNTLRGNFSQIYANYDSFIRFLTIYLAIGNTMNEFMKSSSGYIHMNNITANNLFVLYGLPSVIMEGSSMINFLKKFRLLLMDKGTNVVYRVKDLIGYQYTDIYTLVMVKQQLFENGIPLYNDDGTPKQTICFRRLGTTDDNTSYFKFRDDKTEYSLEEITSGDPRWWNTPEVEEMLQNMNYTLSNSKYIQLSTHISMTDIWWQTVILLRGLLDNNSETKYTKINVNYNIDGSNDMSIFDAVLTLIILMNYQLKDFKGNRANGNLYIPNGKYNGKAACLDMLFNGLNIAQKFEDFTFYEEGSIVGVNLDQLYVVQEDFTSGHNDIDYYILNGKLKAYEGTWDEGSPKPLVLGSPFKVASFNYNIQNTDPMFYESLYFKDYLEPDVFMPMLNDVLNRKTNNIGMSLMTDVKSIYSYLENKLRDSTTIEQFRQVTDTYNKLFLVDPLRDWNYGMTDNTDELLMDEYNLTETELVSLKTFFKLEPNSPDFTLTYNDKEYPIYLYSVMNAAVYNLPIYPVGETEQTYPFREDGFVQAFVERMQTFVSPELESSNISRVIKRNYQSIISSKVEYDSSNTQYGPKTFDALLRVSNPSLYKYIRSMVGVGSSDITLLLRAIIKALEDYVNTSLSGLEFSSLGPDSYFRVLKEVITYFKSYMVEFAKDEFVYIFGGIFDNGGNSDMLRLYDDIPAVEYLGVPHDSTSLFDASYANMDVPVNDSGLTRVYDECVFRMETTYQMLQQTGYDIFFDSGNGLSRTPFPDIEPSSKVTGNMIYDKSLSAYKIIINKENVERRKKNWYGTLPPQ